MPASMIPGPAPVMTIQSRSAIAAASAAGLVVERVVGLRAGRAEDRDLARRAVRREHVERVAHLLQRGVRDLEVAAVGAVAREAQRRRDQLEDRGRRSRPSPSCVDELGDRGVELGVAGAVAGELRAIGASAGEQRARRARPATSPGRAPRCEMTSAAASAPSRPQRAEVVAVGEPVEEAGGVEVAGAGGVDELPPGTGCASTTCTSSPPHDHRALLARG